jgi:hypothetical protein
LGVEASPGRAHRAGDRAPYARGPDGAAVSLEARPRGGAAQQPAGLEGRNDARTGMPPGIPGGAMCVQRLDDSLNSAIHISYRISLRSSSMPEPRDPLLKVLTDWYQSTQTARFQTVFHWGLRRARSRGQAPGRPKAGPPKQQGTVSTGGRLGPEGPSTR